MTVPLSDDPAVPRSSMTSRLLIGLAGLLLLGVGVVVTFGVVLIGIVAITIAWFVMRRRNTELSRVRAWVISVVATAVPLLIILGVTMLSAPPITPGERRVRAAEAARSRESMPAWLQKLSPGQQQAAPVADSIANKLLDNRGFMAWIAAIGAMLGSAFIGAFAGTIGWGVAMLGFRAWRGQWLGRTADFPLR